MLVFILRVCLFRLLTSLISCTIPCAEFLHYLNGVLLARIVPAFEFVCIVNLLS